MDELRIHIITYNVATRSPEGNITELLGINEKESKLSLPDFYLIGLQEVKSQPQNCVLDAIFCDPWTNAIRNVLVKYGYVKAKTVRLVGIILSMFCLRKHIIHLRDMQNICTRTGLMGLWGNKGGVSQRLQIYGCSICFINCHLAAHDHLQQERVADYNQILHHQKFKSTEATSILFHDYVFWFGDVNFRLENENNLNADTIIQHIKDNNFLTLLKYDQLKSAMVTGEAFSELIEPDITFPPTYKYIFHSNEYDVNRRPGWTDRILYKVNANVYENVTLDSTPHEYKVIDNFTCSDHRPVIATFTIKVFSNYAERVVKFLPIQIWYTNQENTATCMMGADVDPKVWDWVGVFKENFTSLDEYQGFIYLANNSTDAATEALPNNIRTGDKIELRFYENIIRTPGKYRLLYFSHDSGSVLGMSSPFHLQNRFEGNNVQRVHLDW
ncbi:inositol polyphosphate 5-phosphatase K-like [Rhodnius prolixus]|uniref:Putative skeletal muscle and kidney-enriched inositol phosphatase n=2 Tax=Rhodnius TaxID=13248 RepID=A0A4P6DF99_RHOPR